MCSVDFHPGESCLFTGCGRDPEALQSLIYQLREARTVELRGSRQSVAAEIEAMVKLRDDGVITEEEFQNRKRRLLESDG